jgi:Coenzyme PQQ synthesis protein D (PqqD)
VIRDEAASTRVAVNTQVLHESIDGEVIVIDLTTGSYYSLRGSAAEAWELVQRSPGATSGQVAEAVAAHYTEDAGGVFPAVVRFLQELADEGLVDVVEASDEPVSLSLPEQNGRAPRSFAPPVLEKYTDMQDLVLLDPVHQVDQAGWPRQAADAAP